MLPKYLISVYLIHCFTSGFVCLFIYLFSEAPGEVTFSVFKMSTIAHIVWLHLYETSKIDKAIETENISGCLGLGSYRGYS